MADIFLVLSTKPFDEFYSVLANETWCQCTVFECMWFANEIWKLWRKKSRPHIKLSYGSEDYGHKPYELLLWFFCLTFLQLDSQWSPYVFTAWKKTEEFSVFRGREKVMGFKTTWRYVKKFSPLGEIWRTERNSDANNTYKALHVRNRCFVRMFCALLSE